MDKETSDNFRDEIEDIKSMLKAQRSILFELGLIVMVFVTINYLVIVQMYLLALPTMPGLPQAFIGLALLIAPLFLYGGFFIVNDLRH